MRKENVSELLEQLGRAWMSIAGLFLIVASQPFEWNFLKVSVDRLLAEVGSFLLVVGILHWIYESRTRRQLMNEILETVVGGSRISSSGLRDFQLHSHDVNYASIIENSSTLIIGEHYSSRIFEDFSDRFQRRIEKGMKTTVLLLDSRCPAAQFMKDNFPGFGGASQKIGKIHAIVNQHSSDSAQPLVAFKWHRNLLRYSFVLSDDSIWIKFYRNTHGHSLVPAFCIARGSELFHFFASDVKLLEMEAAG